MLQSLGGAQLVAATADGVDWQAGDDHQLLQAEVFGWLHCGHDLDLQAGQLAFVLKGAVAVDAGAGDVGFHAEVLIAPTARCIGLLGFFSVVKLLAPKRLKASSFCVRSAAVSFGLACVFAMEVVIPDLPGLIRMLPACFRRLDRP